MSDRRGVRVAGGRDCLGRQENPLAHQVILADNQAIFRAGVARVLGQERNLQVVAQCPDFERLKEAVGSLPKSIVIYPASLAPGFNQLLGWIVQTGRRAAVILLHGASLDEADAS